MGAVAQILVEAFHDDPTWAWACPDPAARPEQLRWLWTEMVRGAMRYGTVHLAPGGVATSVWIPPGGAELSPEQEAAFDPQLRARWADGGARVREAFTLFDAAHPQEEPHHYLSLLGTAAAHRGQGHGLGLLADDLVSIDADGMAAYLEASNPANVALYARYGFEPHGSFVLPGGPEVHTMWRPARPR